MTHHAKDNLFPATGPDFTSCRDEAQYRAVLDAHNERIAAVDTMPHGGLLVPYPNIDPMTGPDDGSARWLMDHIMVEGRNPTHDEGAEITRRITAEAKQNADKGFTKQEGVAIRAKGVHVGDVDYSACRTEAEYQAVLDEHTDRIAAAAQDSPDDGSSQWLIESIASQGRMAGFDERREIVRRITRDAQRQVNPPGFTEAETRAVRASGVALGGIDFTECKTEADRDAAITHAIVERIHAAALRK